MTKFAATFGVATTLLATVAAPTFASAQDHYDREHDRAYTHRVERREARARAYDYDRRCRHDRRSSGNKGTVAGALVGGASGALIGGDALGALVGAGVGAVAGHQIAKGRVHC